MLSWLGQAGVLIAIVLLLSAEALAHVGIPRISNLYEATADWAALKAPALCSFVFFSEGAVVGNNDLKDKLIFRYPRRTIHQSVWFKIVSKWPLLLLCRHNWCLQDGMIAYDDERRKYRLPLYTTPDLDIIYDSCQLAVIRNCITNAWYDGLTRSSIKSWSVHEDVWAFQVSERAFGNTNRVQRSLPQSVSREPQCSGKAGNGNSGDSSQPLWWKRIKSFPSGDYKAIAVGAIINLGALIVALVWAYVIGKARREDQ